MASITEHQVINTYYERKIGKKLKNDPNKFSLGCLEVFNTFGIEIDLTSPEKIEKFQTPILHYKYIVTKIQKFQKNGRAAVLAKFPDKTRLFFDSTKDGDANYILKEMEVDNQG